MQAPDLQSEVARPRHELGSPTAENKDDEQITIANYLLTRLEQLGVSVCPFLHYTVELLTTFPSQSVFGVPGDFNMRMYSPFSRVHGDSDI
jgi:pyruvate decarboxylase